MKRLGMKVFVSGPEQFCDKTGEYIPLDEAVEKMDIINLLRVQFERHEQAMNITKEEYHRRYGLTSERVARMKKNAIIMHPAPINRGIEIASEVAECEKSRIYKQMENGVYVRMAVLTMALEGKL